MKPVILGASTEWGKHAVAMDVERLLVTRLLVQANSGGGKSWALRRLLEQMFGAVPQVVIDLDGEFYTLREKFPYVLAAAGAGGDCKVDVRSAPLLARRILEHGFSAIVDLSEMKKHDRARFVRAFLEALMEAPRALWRPLLVVVDEAHQFCPEKDQAESAAAVIDLMTRGRKRGFCGVLATQRISKLAKDAAAECNNKLIGRSALDVDMKRAADELGFTAREEQHRLRALDEGCFYAFGPAIAKAVALVKLGPVQTTHLEPGQGGKTAPPPAPEKLKAILSKLSDLPAEAEAEEGELARLRRENADLRRKSADAGVRPESAAAGISQAIAEGRAQGQAVGYRRALEAVKPIAARLGMLGQTLAEEIPLFQAEIDRALASAPTAVPVSDTVRQCRNASEAPATARPGPAAARGVPRPVADTGSLPRPRQAILEALAWLEAAGIAPARRITLALLARQSPSSSGYDNNLGALRSAGLIDYPATGMVALTDAGRGLAPTPTGRPTSDDLHRTLQEVLPAPRWRILEVLIRVYPQALSREGVAVSAGQSPGSSGYDNNLGALRSLGFIDYPRPGHVVATPALFLD